MTVSSTSNSELLTLEDVALLADDSDSLPTDTKQRLRNLVLQDTRFRGHLDHLESLAREAGVGDCHDRFGTALLAHNHYVQLELADNWEHPAEVLDPEGFIGILYQELIHIARARVQSGDATDRAGKILLQLEGAWAEEQARHAFADRVATHLLTFESAEAEVLLQRVGQRVRWRYKQLRQAAAEAGDPLRRGAAVDS